MTTTNVKVFLVSRELIDEEMTNMYYLHQMEFNDSKLMYMFEDKMGSDEKFKDNILNKLQVDKDIMYLNKLKNEKDKYNAIIKIMNKYLSQSK